MDIKITFINMEHSAPMEAHAQEKLKKISEFIVGPEWPTPKHLELWLKANKLHPHHGVELHLKTPRFSLNTHYEGTDMYYVLDRTIDKMVKLLKKEKSKILDEKEKVETGKKQFSNDKYTL
jgi:ribosomal subunit interface protein